MSTRRARRQSRAPIAIHWCRACARTGTDRSSPSTAHRTLRATSSGWRSPATSWFASAPAISRNGPMRCRASSPRWGRWRDDPGHDARRACIAMIFPDLVADLKARMPALRGRLMANQSLAELTWFRVGGPAQVLFMPEDEADLADFLAHLPAEIPVVVIGLGSNLIVRDGGVPGVVIRLGRGFNGIAIEDTRIRAGTAVPDVKVARSAHEAGLSGLSFMRGIPGAIGGALRMNCGAYGRETKDVLVEARAVDRHGRVHV